MILRQSRVASIPISDSPRTVSQATRRTTLVKLQEGFPPADLRLLRAPARSLRIVLQGAVDAQSRTEEEKEKKEKKEKKKKKKKKKKRDAHSPGRDFAQHQWVDPNYYGSIIKNIDSIMLKEFMIQIPISNCHLI